MGYAAGLGSHFYDWINSKGVAFSIELLSPNSNQHQFSPKGYDNFFILFTGGYGFQCGEFVFGYRGLKGLPILPKIPCYRF